VAAAARRAGVEAIAIPDVATAVQRAVERAPEDAIVLVTGSLYTVGAARTALVPPNLR
jgi:folylpolyglutamate synthase/dihydropteroate synthase